MKPKNHHSDADRLSFVTGLLIKTESGSNKIDVTRFFPKFGIVAVNHVSLLVDLINDPRTEVEMSLQAEGKSSQVVYVLDRIRKFFFYRRIIVTSEIIDLCLRGLIRCPDFLLQDLLVVIEIIRFSNHRKEEL